MARPTGTAAVLARIADPRLRVVAGPSLPAGWSGKQHACAALGRAARHELMVFTDADVRLAPDALLRMAGIHGAAPGRPGERLPAPAGADLVEQLLLPADPSVCCWATCR